MPQPKPHPWTPLLGALLLLFCACVERIGIIGAARPSGEVSGAGQERQGGWSFGCGGGEFGESGRTCGGAGGPEGSSLPALIEVVLRNGLGVCGIEPGGLIEVVGEGFVGDLVVFPTVRPHVEFGLGWSPGGVDQRGGGGLADMGQDLDNRVGIDEERDERERRLAGGTDQREDFIDPSQKSGPPGCPGGGGIRCPRLYPLWLGSRGRGGCRERKGGGPGS